VTQARLIAKNTVVLGLARVIDRVRGLVLALLISRELGPSGLGVFSAALAFYALIAYAAQGGALNLLIREIGKDPSRTNRYVVHIGAMVVAASAVLAGGIWIVVPRVVSGDLGTAFAVVGLAILPGALNIVQEAVFIGRQRVEFETYGTFLATLLNIALAVVLLSQGYGVIAVLIAFVAVQWVLTIAYFVFINRYIERLHWDFQLSTCKETARELKTFTGLSVLAGAFAQPEILILSFFSSSARVGYYSASLKLVNLTEIVSATYMTNVFPVLSRLLHEGDRRVDFLQQKSVKYLLGVSLPVCALLIAAAEPIVQLFYGPGFDQAVTDLRIMAVLVPIVSVNAVLWRALLARGEQGVVFRILAVTLVIRIAVGIGLIAALDDVGASIAVTSMLLLHTVLLGMALHRDGVRLNIVAGGARFTVASAIMGALVWAAVDRIEIWFLAPIAIVVYVALVWVLRALSSDDLALFRSVVRAPGARSAGG
jgi:O-antigen/teichoic acid export membrane protein